MTGASSDYDGAFEQAVARHRSGALSEAEALYRSVLAQIPAHAPANHNLGLVLLAAGDAAAALPLLARALGERPEEAQFWLDYVDALARAGLAEAGWQVLQHGKSIGLDGPAVEALHESLSAARDGAADQDLAAMYNEGRYADVEAISRTLLIQVPRNAQLWELLGHSLLRLGHREEGLDAVARSAALEPGNKDIQYRAGLAFSEVGDPARAEAALRTALAIDPGYLLASGKLASILNDLNRPKDALDTLMAAVALEPANAGLHNEMGNAYLLSQDFPRARVALEKALVLDPANAPALNNLSLVYANLLDLSEAERFCRLAIQTDPQLVQAHTNLAEILRLEGRLVEAMVSCDTALRLSPGNGDIRQLGVTLRSHLSDYAAAVEESDRAIASANRPPVIWETRLYTFSYHPDQTAEAIYGEFVRWGDRFPGPVVDFSGHDRTPGRKLKIGYVSPDFRKHTSRFYFMPLMANHDHQAFETFAYSNVLVEDEHTETFKGVFDQWRDIRGLDTEAAARLIREDGIDILVDCCNHMRDDRLDIFALKPAPIQVTWLGAAWTTGLRTIDYVLFDPYLAPEGTLAREEIVRLPHCFIAYRPPETTAEVAALPAKRNGHVTFGYSGRTERLNHHTFRVWGEILNRIPGSKLILDYRAFADPPTQDYYRRFMAEHGLDSDRVEMRCSTSIFKGLGDIDILLDCFPHSGGTMLFDALWMGVPALTLKARPPLGRIGTTLMTNLGMIDWVAESAADYIDKALAFAADLPALAETRQSLRERMRASPLMDEQGFAKGVEDAYRKMWLRFIQPAGPDARQA